jgi:hypothetical protein
MFHVDRIAGVINQRQFVIAASALVAGRVLVSERAMDARFSAQFVGYPCRTSKMRLKKERNRTRRIKNLSLDDYFADYHIFD